MGQSVLLIRFNDSDSDDLVRPVDEVGNLAELVKTGADYPGIVEAELGYGRSFTSSELDGLAAQDIDSGSTLLTRNASIRAAIAWDFDATALAGAPATIYARGKGTAAAEYLSAGLELRVINAASRIAEVRWIWMDLAGALMTQIGGHFQVPSDGEIILTATRRWVSSSSVVLRYYLGDALLAEVESADGEIGGGTTGTTSIGTRYNAAGAAWYRHFDGVIDELQVVDDELSEEEVRATWNRITVEQPRGYQLLQELHDPGFPISKDRSSRAQRETRLWGHALGFAAAQAENIRENILPDRAYGETLERWERMTKQPAHAGDDVYTRRRRVVGRIRQRLGVSIPGVGDALDELLDTDPTNLEIVAFDATMSDDWSTLNTPRWRHDPSAQWTIAASKLRVQSAGVRSVFSDWYTSLMSVQADGRAVKMLAKLAPTTIQTQGEVGLMFVDRAANNAFLFGMRNDAGTYRLVTATVTGGAIAAATNRAAPGLVPVWLQLWHDDAAATYSIKWSTTSADGPWTEVASIAGPMSTFQWAGFYCRTFSAAAANVDVSIDDSKVRDPYGDRTRRFYVIRDPADPGDPDYLAADAILQGLKQAHTLGHVARTATALYDDDSTGYDLEPMGGV